MTYKIKITPTRLVENNTPESLRGASGLERIVNSFTRRIKLLLFRKTYVLPSHYFDGPDNRKIEKYLVLSNGVLKQGMGKAGWIAPGQLFLKKHFWLGNENNYFSVLFYSGEWMQVRHTYYVSSYNEDYFKIEWVSQNQETGLRNPSFVEIPMNYSDNSVPEDKNVPSKRNVFFLGDMGPGDSVKVDIVIKEKS